MAMRAGPLLGSLPQQGLAWKAARHQHYWRHTQQKARRIPCLQTVLAEAVEEFVGKGARPAEEMLRGLVACELAYINTCHPGFIGGNRAIAQVRARVESAQRGRSTRGVQRCARLGVEWRAALLGR